MRIYFATLKIGFFFLGLWFVALGFVFCYEAKLGVAPWDVLHTGLHQVTSFSIGFWSIAIGLAILCITFFLNRSLIGWGTVGNMFFIGYFMDLIMKMDLVPSVHNMWLRIFYMVVGIIMSALGGGLYLAPGYGAGPRDGFTLEMAKRLRISIRKMRTIIEVVVVIIGWLLGGAVFVGTILFSLTIGPFFQYFLQLFERFIGFLIQKVDADNIHVKYKAKAEER